MSLPLSGAALGVLLLLGCIESTAAPTAPASETSAKDARTLRLMSYNVLYSNRRPSESLDAIARADADVVLLQEVTGVWEERLRDRFRKQYPHQRYRTEGRAAGGIAVLSKLPLASEELWSPPYETGAYFPAQRVRVTTPAGVIQIVNVHLRPAIDGGSWIKGFFSTPPIRRAEIAAHFQKFDRTLPTIVAGDFNEDPDGRALDFLAGHGFARVPTTGPTTWRYEVPDRDGGKSEMLKMDIDHVVIDKHFAATDAHVMDVGASDHRPVVVTLTRK